jgi:hypothetical protein
MDVNPEGKVPGQMKGKSFFIRLAFLICPSLFARLCSFIFVFIDKNIEVFVKKPGVFVKNIGSQPGKSYN